MPSWFKGLFLRWHRIMYDIMWGFAAFQGVRSTFFIPYDIHYCSSRWCLKKHWFCLSLITQSISFVSFHKRYHEQSLVKISFANIAILQQPLYSLHLRFCTLFSQMGISLQRKSTNGKIHKFRKCPSRQNEKEKNLLNFSHVDVPQLIFIGISLMPLPCLGTWNNVFKRSFMFTCRMQINWTCDYWCNKCCKMSVYWIYR